MPSWDNTARRQNTPTIIVNATPDLYGEWLSYLRAYTRDHQELNDNFIFINAWNEWGEGCHLEPDLRWGSRYLETTYRSAFYSAKKNAQNNSKEALKNIIEIIEANCDATILDQKLTASVTLNNLMQYKPPGAFAREVSFKLSKFPMLHKVAKWIYRKLI
jgi:lipopolysaccharide biosynthesis protein